MEKELLKHPDTVTQEDYERMIQQLGIVEDLKMGFIQTIPEAAAMLPSKTQDEVINAIKQKVQDAQKHDGSNHAP